MAVLWALMACWELVASAADFTLTDGTLIQGEASSFNDEGLIIRLKIGGFSERIPWIKFTQETLKELVKDQKNAQFVEPFIELTAADLAKIKAEKEKEIVLKPVPRVARPQERGSLFAAATMPLGLAVLSLLFVANLYAAYEIAGFRNRPAALVCGVSAIMPIVGPILFLSLPTVPEEAGVPELMPLAGGGGAAAPAAPAEAHGSATSKLKSKITGMFGKKQGAGLSLAATEKAGAPAGPPPTKTYAKGEYTFNRRFFETQFPGFFRVVPSEAEKDLVLSLKAGRNEYVGKRITRISMNELHLQLLSGGEVSVAFADVSQVQVRHKDAKA
jgi:hypothetical protein